MKFSMLKIRGLEQTDGDYIYESMIMEKGASPPWKNTFESEFEMVSIVNDILARQKRNRDIRPVLSRIHGGEHYFFDLDLTEEQARILGWQPTSEIDLVGVF